MTRTLSRFFPADHQRAGEPTHFVEKFLNTMLLNKMGPYSETAKTPIHTRTNYMDYLVILNQGKPYDLLFDFYKSLYIHSEKVIECKKHTIRLGNSIKDGQMLQLAVWSGKPYNSPQIKIWEPVKVWVQDCDIERFSDGFDISVCPRFGFKPHTLYNLEVAKNDGLTLSDFQSWFRKAEGQAQIIHWTDLRY